MTWLTAFLLIMNTGISVGGMILLKLSLQTQNPLLTACGAVLWTSSSVIFLALAERVDLSTITICLQACGLIATVMLAWAFFDEPITRQKVVGISLVTVGIVVASWPTGSS